MMWVHSVGLDLALCGTFLNPLRAALGAEGPTLRTHHKDHPLRATDRARGQRHHFSSSPSYLARLQVPRRVKPVPRGEKKGPGVGKSSPPTVSRRPQLAATVGGPIFALGQRAHHIPAIGAMRSTSFGPRRSTSLPQLGPAMVRASTA